MMARSYTCMIDDREVEVDVEVTGYTAEERPTWDCPGGAAEVEFDLARVVVGGELVAEPDQELISRVSTAIYDKVLRDEERDIGESRADARYDLRSMADDDAAAWRDGRGW